VFERVWALPTFEIHGIRGGFTGDGAKTVIPAAATAKVSLRLVPGQRYQKVARQLERAVAPKCGGEGHHAPGDGAGGRGPPCVDAPNEASGGGRRA
jgi:acetylornithine deacetylase/succinyl-diaminopimelate desuccinylase-like protein